MKALLVNIISVISYFTGIDALFYFLNRKAKRIITFHNVLPDALFRKTIANGVSCSLSTFQNVVKECEKKFRISNDMFNARTLTITFDDGYYNQYSVAFKALRDRNIPAYVFISDMGNEELLIDKLLHWVSEVPIEFIPGGDRMQYWVKTVWPRFFNSSDRMGRTVFDELDKKYSYAKIRGTLSSDYLRERLSRISSEALSEMREAGWEVGWHTINHYPLSRLNDDLLRQELSSPKDFRRVCLSYPYGNPVEVGTKAVRLAESLGYPCAVSNTNIALENTSPFFLPRMSLPSNKFRLHFRLSGLEHFIRYRRLLPIIEHAK